MKTVAIKVLPLGVFLTMTACTDLKPLQGNLDDLKAQVGKLATSVSGARAAAESASLAATQASQTAASAQNSANQALMQAKSQQSSIADINAKMDRIFRKSVSK